MSDQLHSAIYAGHVRHRRSNPPHTLCFPLYMAFLDLGELPTVLHMSRWWGASRWSPARFVRGDYLQHHGEPDLATAVRATVAEHTGERPDGPVRMLTHLRQFGYVFNPVTFYYCHDLNGSLHSIVAQITNTPWKQRHAYVLPLSSAMRDSAVLRWSFAKQFHVSPFLPMNVSYCWTFSRPAQATGSRLAVHMDLRPHSPPGAAATRDSFRSFDATLSLKREELSPAAMRRKLLRFPLITAQVTASIHFNALRLWFKRAGVCDHPSPSTPTTPHTSSRAQ